MAEQKQLAFKELAAFAYRWSSKIWRDPNGRVGIGAVSGAIIGGVSGFAGSAVAGGGWKKSLQAGAVNAVLGAAAGFLGDPSGGVLTGSNVALNAALGGLVGAYSNIIGQSMAGQSLRCLNWGSVAVSAAGGVLGAGVGTILKESAGMIAGPLGYAATISLEATGGVTSMATDAIAAVMDRR